MPKGVGCVSVSESVSWTKGIQGEEAATPNDFLSDQQSICGVETWGTEEGETEELRCKG